MDSRYSACTGTGHTGMTIECKYLSFPCFHSGRLCETCARAGGVAGIQ